MTSRVVEQVARAIHQHVLDNEEPGEIRTFDDCREAALRMASVAIEAMREPTPEMVEIGANITSTVPIPIAALQIWRAMIDAALVRRLGMDRHETAIGPQPK